MRLRSHKYQVVVLLALLTISAICLAQHEQAYVFLGSNGLGPAGGVIVDASGNFYGTTAGGGSSKFGIVYQMILLSGNVTETVLYQFTGSANNGDGAYPFGDLVFDQSGNLYGVTEQGGTYSEGTVFELSPPAQPGGSWTETVLHSFQGGPADGAKPVAGLVLDEAGNLYGTTPLGGIDGASCVGGCGTVFELSPPSHPGGGWSETTLYMFQGQPDGSQPMGALVFDSAGNLYGTASLGGKFGPGAIFELTPPSSQGGLWTESVIHSLNTRTDGDVPMAGLTLNGNTLFGTTSEGGPLGHGTVFRLLPPPNGGGAWTYEVVHAFAGPDGSGPQGPVILPNPNTLYGTTAGGGGGSGTVFEISSSGGIVTETVLWNFGGSNGSQPASSLILHNFALYGSTPIGGYENGGVVFRLSR